MLRHIVLVGASLVSLIACSGEEPATPEQKRTLVEIVDAAKEQLPQGKRYRGLPAPELPAVDTGADFYIIGDNEMRMVHPRTVITKRGDSAEILFTVSVQIDSATRENRDVYVLMARDSGAWRMREHYVVAR